MNKFEKYLSDLAAHEESKSKKQLDPRGRILVNAGVGLNWIGDYLANPKIKYRKIKLPVEKILFTGTNPGWNKILLERCDKSVEKFSDLMAKNAVVRKKFETEASFGSEPILLRGPDESGMYRVLDGMHRFVGAVLKDKKTITAYAPINEGKYLPVCEAHVVYDLIRGFQRHAKDKQGEVELYHALKLLTRTYGNATELLKRRFSYKYVADKEVQAVIAKVIKEFK
ncbi:hypothetical protein HGA34_01370 [Candidatus Falkowbacteria bacterium]|nr:hypothetical protein [Candidatus Falkowbacteria bacterium]